MVNKKRSSKIFVVLLTIACLWSAFVACSEAEDTSIEAAQASINNAFTNILAIEKLGGNITALLLRLNNATELLAQADNMERSGTTINMTSNSNSARQIADQVNEDAINLYSKTLAASQTNFWLIIAMSTIGIIIFVSILLLAWRFFKRRYMNKLLRMKPEVIGRPS
jgi:hypothetical protein